MPAQTPPDDPVEREFRSLARKLRVARGFCYAVLFVADARASRRLRTRLAALLERDAETLHVVAPTSAAKLVSQTLAGIFDAAAPPAGARVVIWAEAFRERGDPEWDAQRQVLLMRMNERRSRFESQLGAPLLLLLPEGAQRDAATYAPDLWHVRLHSGVLATGAEETSDLAPASLAPAHAWSSSPEAPVLASATPKALAYWESLFDAASRSLEPGALDALSLPDGISAVQSLLSMDQVGRATQLAATLVAMARDRAARTAAGDGSARQAALATLAATLRVQGEALVRAGRADEARSALQDGLALVGPPSATGGESLSTVATRQLLLIGLGDLELACGAPGDAAMAYDQALASERQRRGSLPGSASLPHVEGALLARLGHTALASHDYDLAVGYYTTSAAALREAARAGNDDPVHLGFLAIVLTWLGDAQWDRRQGEHAVRAYREALGVLRRLQSLRPDDVQQTKNLLTLLVRLGHAEQESGHADAALAAYEEGLTLCRLLRSQGIDLGSLATELAMPLQRLAVATRARDASGFAEATRLHAALAGALSDPSRTDELLDAAGALLERLLDSGAGPK